MAKRARTRRCERGQQPDPRRARPHRSSMIVVFAHVPSVTTTMSTTKEVENENGHEEHAA